MTVLYLQFPKESSHSLWSYSHSPWQKGLSNFPSAFLRQMLISMLLQIVWLFPMKRLSVWRKGQQSKTTEKLWQVCYCTQMSSGKLRSRAAQSNLPCSTRQASQVGGAIQDIEFLEPLQTAIQCGQRSHSSSCGHDGHHWGLCNAWTERAGISWCVAADWGPQQRPLATQSLTSLYLPGHTHLPKWFLLEHKLPFIL